MAKRKRKPESRNLEIIIAFKLAKVLSSILYFLFVSLGGSLIIALFLMILGQDIAQSFRYAMIGVSIPTIFALFFRWKYGRWPESNNDDN